jgi:hypothetical protein
MIEHIAAAQHMTATAHKWGRHPKNIHFRASPEDAKIINEMAAAAELYWRLVASGEYGPAQSGVGWIRGYIGKATKAELDAAARRHME